MEAPNAVPEIDLGRHLVIFRWLISHGVTCESPCLLPRGTAPHQIGKRLATTSVMSSGRGAPAVNSRTC